MSANDLIAWLLSTGRTQLLAGYSASLWCQRLSSAACTAYEKKRRKLSDA